MTTKYPKSAVPNGMEDEALEKLANARRYKVQFELDLREGYFFAAPHRARNVLSNVRTSEVKPRDFAALNASFAFELCGDFPTVIMNTFLPESENWAKREAGMDIPDMARDRVNKEAKVGDDAIFRAIAASNFYPACGMGFTPDLALGTVALWIERNQAWKPINCQPIPLRELEISTGPFGGIDDRFVSRWTHARHLPALTRGLNVPKEWTKKIKDEPGAWVNITWGFWRDWEEDEEECWHHVVLLDTHLINYCRLRGAGCCPLIVARFNPSPEWPWGVGPLIQALPDLRVFDALTESKLRNIELGMEGPITWPDDSWTNIEEGLECRMAYPIRPGSHDAIKSIYTPNPPDAAIYEKNDLEQRLRRLFFLDFPQQPGKTPPTATQWLDETTLAQQRIGTPGLIFWSEFCGGVFTRFQYILEQDGAIKPIKVDGKRASLQPYNPAQRAAEQQDVAAFTRFVQIAGAMAPEEFKIQTDGLATIMILARKLGVEDIWRRRSPEQLQQAIAQIQKLQAGQAPTAPQAGPQGVAPPQQEAGVAPPPPTTAINLGRAGLR
jgi:Bacteriophage head to tail connecting protein